jgi:hypothetical protein
MLAADLLLVTNCENTFSLYLTSPIMVCVVDYLRHSRQNTQQTAEAYEYRHIERNLGKVLFLLNKFRELYYYIVRLRMKYTCLSCIIHEVFFLFSSLRNIRT